jgi:hypothetical protein
VSRVQPLLDGFKEVDALAGKAAAAINKVSVARKVFDYSEIFTERRMRES